ncbi:MAG: phosphoribosylanthranilate isomerase [Phycisphaeraceae bacterium]
MPRTRIKICGITTVEAAQTAAAAGADAVGLMFAEGSPRTIDMAQAQRIAAALPAFVEPVGVFLNQSIDFVRDVAARLPLRTVQLHGHETPTEAAALAPLRVIKALSFDDGLDAALAPWRGCANLAALMFDAPPPERATLTGGHGTAFDWDALAALKQRGALDELPPIVLAGGLTPDNVAEAIATVQPYGVDVSSGVESARGVKDPGKIVAFCEAARGARSGPSLRSGPA